MLMQWLKKTCFDKCTAGEKKTVSKIETTTEKSEDEDISENWMNCM